MKTVARFFAAALVCTTAVAQWSADPSVNSIIVSGKQNVNSPSMISDGSSGAYVAWDDQRTAYYNIYLQHVDGSGKKLWTADGLLPTPSTVVTGVTPSLCSDGTGGLIVAFLDERDTLNGVVDITLQRISRSGVRVWDSTGVNITHNTIFDLGVKAPLIFSDGSSGAFVVWGQNFGLKIARVSSAGQLLWTKLIDSFGELDFTAAVSGTSCIVVWNDMNMTYPINTTIAAQKLDLSGTRQWALDSVVVCNSPNGKIRPQIVGDDAGGGIIAWEDYRNGSYYRAFSQKLSPTGARQWIAANDSNGVLLSNRTTGVNKISMVYESGGGAIVTWSESSTKQPYVQKVSSTGTLPWGTNGVALSTTSATNGDNVLVSDGVDGAIVVWTDYRNTGINTDIYSQRISSVGAVQWPTTGAAVSSALKNQVEPFVVSNNGGAIVGFFDMRDANNNAGLRGISLQRVNGNGTLTGIRNEFSQLPVGFSLSQNYPNPFNPTTVIRYQMSANSFVSLRIFDVLGREVATLVDGEMAAGTYRVSFDASGLSSGVYYHTLKVGSSVETRKMILAK